MTVRMAVTNGLVAGGGGGTTSVDGISPAKVAPESTHVRATAKTKRLISGPPIDLEMQTTGNENSILHMLDFLHGWASIARIRS